MATQILNATFKLAVVQMELNGIFFDGERIKPFAQECKRNSESLKVLLHIGLGDINLNNPEELTKSLQNMGISVENTKRETLIPLAEKHNVIKMLIQYRKLTKYAEFIDELTRHIPFCDRKNTRRI